MTHTMARWLAPYIMDGDAPPRRIEGPATRSYDLPRSTPFAVAPSGKRAWVRCADETVRCVDLDAGRLTSTLALAQVRAIAAADERALLAVCVPETGGPHELRRVDLDEQGAVAASSPVAQLPAEVRVPIRVQGWGRSYGKGELLNPNSALVMSANAYGVVLTSVHSGLVAAFDAALAPRAVLRVPRAEQEPGHLIACATARGVLLGAADAGRASYLALVDLEGRVVAESETYGLAAVAGIDATTALYVGGPTAGSEGGRYEAMKIRYRALELASFKARDAGAVGIALFHHLTVARGGQAAICCTPESAELLRPEGERWRGTDLRLTP